MIRVTFVLQEPTPYRTPHLALLAAHPELELTVVYASRTVQRRTWTVSHESAIFLSGPKLPLGRIIHHDFALTPGIWPLLGRLRPDVVAVGGWSILATQLAILWCQTHEVPYLLMSDSHLREPRPRWTQAVKRAVLPRIVPQAAGWLVPGSLALEHLAAYGADAARTAVFPLTVDVGELSARTDALRPERDEARVGLGIAPHAVAVLGVGRLVPFKAPDLLVRAVSRARASAPGPLHLVLVGDGPLEAELRELARAEGIAVTFTGLLEGDDLLRAYVAADVFALLSRRETWGVVVNEAMCAGLPLVLSDAVGAATDLLEPGRNGLLVPAGGLDEAARAIAQLASEPALRRTFGDRSRQLISSWGYTESVEAFVRLARDVTAAR
ncbi:MAG: glycosyltransferase family 4 protein [Actinobacteria bacterium]|nr:glycosyltransferase family 4 protein [Actinomycetota bacterium]